MKKLRTIGLLAVLVGVMLAFPGDAKAGCAMKYEGTCVVSSDFYFGEAPDYTVAKAVYYAPGIMEATAVWREMNCAGFAGCVSLQFAGDIGEVVHLRRPGHDWEGPFLVVDSAQQNHLKYHATYIQEHVEVSFETAVKWGMAAVTSDGWKNLKWMIRDVEVYKGIFPPDEDQEPINFAKWVAENAENATSVNDYRVWEYGDFKYSDYSDYLAAKSVFNMVSTGDIYPLWVNPSAYFDYLMTSTPDYLYKVKVTSHALSIRSGPSAENIIASYASQGDVLKVYDAENGWYRVDGGWVSAKYVIQVGDSL